MLNLLRAMRPKQWAKNLFFVFAPLVFDEKLFVLRPLLSTTAAFILFCLASSAVYLINDLVDIEKDRQHPTKRNRPLASGQLSPRVAVVTAGLLFLICVPCGFWLQPIFGLILLGYLVLQIAYSFWLKNVVIVDVMVVAAGFVLRVAGGVTVIPAERFSPWLYVCTTLLALFLAVSKRRQEIVLLAENANAHRAILNEYSLRFLDEIIALVTSTTMVAYSLYTFSAPNLPANHAMMLTIPFVLYGLFRYLYLIHVRGEVNPPDEMVFKDKPLLVNILLFGLAVVLILYFL